MLGVVEELNHVEAAVARFEELRLGSATHPPDQANGVKGHGSRGT
jgi:hypothetical protein